MNKYLRYCLIFAGSILILCFLLISCAYVAIKLTDRLTNGIERSDKELIEMFMNNKDDFNKMLQIAKDAAFKEENKYEGATLIDLEQRLTSEELNFYNYFKNKYSFITINVYAGSDKDEFILRLFTYFNTSFAASFEKSISFQMKKPDNYFNGYDGPEIEINDTDNFVKPNNRSYSVYRNIERSWYIIKTFDD